MTDQTPALDERPDDELDAPDEHTDETLDEPDPGDEQTDEPDANPALRKARREARNLRSRLTTAEQERDTARASVERLMRARAEEIAVDMGLIDGADLWRHGVNLGDLYARDDDDNITAGLDPQRVQTAVRDFTRDRPNLLRRKWRPRGNDHLTYQQRMKWGIEPAPDAPEQEWADYAANRSKFLRSGATPADTFPAAGPSWHEALGH